MLANFTNLPESVSYSDFVTVSYADEKQTPLDTYSDYDERLVTRNRTDYLLDNANTYNETITEKYTFFLVVKTPEFPFAEPKPDAVNATSFCFTGNDFDSSLFENDDPYSFKVVVYYTGSVPVQIYLGAEMNAEQEKLGGQKTQQSNTTSAPLLGTAILLIIPLFKERQTRKHC